MTNETKHTPTPWKTDGYYIETAYETIARCGTSTLTVAEDHANAVHIVKCVNMHDELVGYLMVALDILSEDGDKPRVCADIRETLKKAGAI